MKKCKHQINKRCDKDHGIKPVHNSPVSRDQMPVIFQVMVPLDSGSKKVPELRKDRTQQSHTGKLPKNGGIKRLCLHHKKTKEHSDQCCTKNTAKRTCHGFLGREEGDQLSLPQGSSAQICEDITDPRHKRHPCQINSQLALPDQKDEGEQKRHIEKREDDTKDLSAVIPGKRKDIKDGGHKKDQEKRPDPPGQFPLLSAKHQTCIVKNGSQIPSYTEA